MSEIDNRTASKSARSKSAFNWPMMGLAGAFVVYIAWVWVNDYRINHAPPTPPAVSAAK